MISVSIPRRTTPAIDLALTETVVAGIRAERDLCGAEAALRAARTAVAIEGARRTLQVATMRARLARQDVLDAIAEEGRARA